MCLCFVSGGLKEGNKAKLCWRESCAMHIAVVYVL